MRFARFSLLLVAFLGITVTITTAVVVTTCQQDWCLVLEWQKVRAADSYERCVDLGFPVQESYPARCVAGSKSFLQPVGDGPNAIVACPQDARLCPDGTTLSREGPDCAFPACPGETPCVAQGCSGELCAEEGASLMSDCAYKAEYACYLTAACERQGDGNCGWTQTTELTSCLEQQRVGAAEVPL